MSTLAAIQAGEGARLGFVMAIEGYEYLLVYGSDESNVAADVVSTSGAGWNGTAWSQALSGLVWNPTITRSIKPWEHKFDVPTLTCTVLGQLHSDQFGIDAFKRGGGTETELAAAIDCNDSTITVVDAGDFASSGDIWIGTERISYSGKTATTFTGCTRGVYSPFATEGGTANRYGRRHDLPDQTWDVAIAPKVTDAPRKWVGRMVGVWAHAIRNGVWDTKADAVLVFAGQITDIGDTEKGNTVLGIEDLAGKLRNTTLFREQFRGKVSEGISIPNNIGAEVQTGIAETFNHGASAFTDTANALTLTTGSEADTHDIPPGVYTAEELCAQITEWLSADADIAGAWAVEVAQTGNGTRTRISVDLDGTGLAGLTRCKFVLLERWATFLGFDGFDTEYLNGGQAAKIFLDVIGTGSGAVYSANPPARIFINLFEELNLDSSQGEWFDNSLWLPQEWQDQYVGSAEEWGILQLGESVYALARKISDTQFEIQESKALTRMFGASTFKDVNFTIAADDGGAIEVRQVAMLYGSFKSIINHLFYSTGTTDHNSSNGYDRLPATLGAAIPGELLGSTFESSVDLLNEASTADNTMVVLGRATPLEESIGAELLLRNAWLSFDQGYVFVTASTAGVSAHTLTERDKRSAVRGDPQAEQTQTTREHIRNIIKVEYNKELSTGKFTDTIQVVHAASVNEHNTERALTIEAHNSYGQYAPTGASIEALAADLVANVMPMWSAPISVSRRTIGPEFFLGVRVGDIATVSSDHIRNPETGARGLVGKPGVILSHSYTFGGNKKDMFGEVTIAFAALDDEPIYSPCAYVASYSDPTLTLEAHAHTKSSESADASFFADGDEILIIERDPANSASAQSWNVTLAADPSGNNLNVGALSGYDSNKNYMVVSRNYSTAVAAQKPKAYMADDADLAIQDERRPYVWGGLYNGGAISSSDDATALPERHADEWFSDGFPINPGSHSAIARFINNAISYKTAISIPWTYEGGARSTPSAGVSAPAWVPIDIFPVSIGAGYVVAQTQRVWRVRPQFRSSTGGVTVQVRVTFTRTPPVSGTSGSTSDLVFTPPFSQLTFSTSSATYAIIAEQTAEPVNSPETGEGWVIVEGKSGTNPTVAQILGFPKFDLGPFS